jgi:DNA-binding NtrC family response regulator
VADDKQRTILLVADRRSSMTARLLRRSGFSVVTTFSVDHAVAVSVNREYAAVVLDQDLFIEVDGRNVAQSLKQVRLNTCVILITRGIPSAVSRLRA